MTKEFTVKDVFEALAKNGFEHLREQWTAQDMDGVIIGGCILQQGAMNLNVWANGNTFSLEQQLNKFHIYDWELIRGPIGYPDDDYEDVQDQFEIENENEKPYEGAGSTVIWWNDASVDGEYILKTYEDVVDKAREILAPFFNEKVTLADRIWDFRRKAEAV